MTNKKYVTGLFLSLSKSL